MAGILIGLFGVAGPWIAKRHFPLWPWCVGGAFLIAALLVPRSLKWVRWGWMKLGRALGAVNSRIILGAVFFVVVVPIAIIMRLLGRDTLFRKFDAALATYRVPRESGSERSTLEDPY
jgi:hypothetical protein